MGCVTGLNSSLQVSASNVFFAATRTYRTKQQRGGDCSYLLWCAVLFAHQFTSLISRGPQGSQIHPRAVSALGVWGYDNTMTAGNVLNLALLIVSIFELLALKVLGGSFVSPRSSLQPGSLARAQTACVWRCVSAAAAGQGKVGVDVGHLRGVYRIRGSSGLARRGLRLASSHKR